VNILGRLAPPVTALCIDNFKESLQAEQATAIVAKLFELHHDAMLSTPTGEFVQLIGKVFRNLDTLLPALYGAVIPVVVEVCFAVSFITIAWRTWIGLIQLGLFVVFTVAAYQAAKRKAQRNKDMMHAMLSEWGKILGTATSYERAHFFNNVDYEVAQARECFEKIGSKITAVSSGEHLEGMVLTGVDMYFALIDPPKSIGQEILLPFLFVQLSSMNRRRAELMRNEQLMRGWASQPSEAAASLAPGQLAALSGAQPNARPPAGGRGGAGRAHRC